MNILRLLSLAMLSCALLIGCGQIDQTMKYLEQADAVAADLEAITGIKPTTSAQWENDEFKEFVVEFSQTPDDFSPGELRAHARQLVATYFGSSPRQLTVLLTDADH
jgi:hypothetical protein